MKIRATLKNSLHQNDVTVETDGNRKEIAIPAKPSGLGSSVNGAELLFLSLATCFCNDLYREAGRRKIEIQSAEITVRGEFGKEGEPASNITYTANIQSEVHPSEIVALIKHVDEVAEIHNTLRKGVHVTLRHEF